MATALERLTEWDKHPRGRADYQRTRKLTDAEKLLVQTHWRWANAPRDRDWHVQEWSYDQGQSWYASWSF